MTLATLARNNAIEITQNKTGGLLSVASDTIFLRAILVIVYAKKQIYSQND